MYLGTFSSNWFSDFQICRQVDIYQAFKDRLNGRQKQLESYQISITVYYVILNCNLKSINYNAVILNLIRTNHYLHVLSQNLQTLTTTLLRWLHFEHHVAFRKFSGTFINLINYQLYLKIWVKYGFEYRLSRTVFYTNIHILNLNKSSFTKKIPGNLTIIDDLRTFWISLSLFRNL